MMSLYSLYRRPRVDNRGRQGRSPMSSAKLPAADSTQREAGIKSEPNTPPDAGGVSASSEARRISTAPIYCPTARALRGTEQCHREVMSRTWSLYAMRNSRRQAISAHHTRLRRIQRRTRAVCRRYWTQDRKHAQRRTLSLAAKPVLAGARGTERQRRLYYVSSAR